MNLEESDFTMMGREQLFDEFDNFNKPTNYSKSKIATDQFICHPRFRHQIEGL